MSKRYIPQTPNNNFVYPNNDRVEYDLVISHPINDNCPTGTISGLTLSQSTSSAITLEYDFTFDQNGSIPFFSPTTNDHVYISVHMLTPVQTYMKPWRIVDSLSSSTYSPTRSGSQSVYISASDFGVDGFYSGTYTFEFRLISEDCVTVICDSAVLVGITPTPTPIVPTPTAGGPTPTATPTPTPTPTATAESLSCTTWGLTGSTLSGELLIVQYNDCNGDPQEEVIGWNSQNPITRTICAINGSVVIVDQGLGTDAQDTLTPCT